MSRVLKLAKYLGKSSLTNLFVLDEPSTGLHSDDVTRLIDVLRALCNTGATVIAIEHNRDFIRAADWNVELGPGAGPDGGRLIYAGPVEAKSVIDSTRSGDPSVIDHAPPAAGALGKPAGIGTIEIRGAVANNLDRIDLDIKKGELCVITGRSGSGKSSLVHDVLEVESRRRYLESLSLYERQSVSERSGNKVSRVGGIGVTMSFGTRRFRYSPRDDVARITGIGLDLASLYSRLGRLPGEEADHVRQTIGPSQFLPGTYSSACPECHGVGTQLEPAPSKLIVDPELPICGGAMHSPGFFPKGYICKPYNGGYYLVRALGECFGFDPETTRWSRMSEEARQAFLFGTERPILVRYENRKGVVSEREQQFPGFYGWIRDWDVGGTFTNTVPCPGCSGAGFRESILRVELGGWSIHRARTATFGELRDWIDSLSALELRSDSQSKRDAERLGSKLLFLANVGLSYLTSTQAAHSLSAGESQRLRLAGLLGSGLGSMTIILDEPTRGMHPQEIDGLIAVLLRLVDERNTVIVVEHDMSLIGAADTIIELGPGSGRNGGRIVANGTLSKISTGASVTGRALRGEISFPIEHSKLSNSTPRMIVRGARSNNLMSIDVEFPLGRITAVCGVSGSGKSTLVVDTLAMALSPRKQTTSVAYEPTVPGEHDSIDGAPGSTVLIDQSRAGVQHPGAYLGIEAAMQRHYLEVASEAGYESRDLKRDCSGCGGSGIVKTDMGFLPPIHQACEACDGSGYSGTALEFRVRGFTLAEIGRLTIDEVAEIYYDSQRIAALTEDASSIGLGYLSLRQPSHALSGGELQRLKIAKQLSRAVRGPTLYILDEPTVGLHLADVAALVKSLYALRKSGGTVIVVEHHPNMIAACDWIVELGPGGGPDGGTLVFEGDPEEFIRAGTATSPYVAEVLG